MQNNTRAVRDFVESLKNVKVFLDVHSYGQLIVFPNGYTKTKSQYDDVLVSQLMNRFGFNLHSVLRYEVKDSQLN